MKFSINRTAHYSQRKTKVAIRAAFQDKTSYNLECDSVSSLNELEIKLLSVLLLINLRKSHCLISCFGLEISRNVTQMI